MNNILIFIAVHVLISSACCLWWGRANKEEGFYRFVVVFFIPILGLLYLIFVDFWGKINKSNDGNLGTLHSIEKDVTGTGYMRLDFEREASVIPMEEALIVNSGDVKRKLIVDTLKEDIERYMAYLSRALGDEDTETSHYAAATIMEVRRRLSLAMQDLAVKYEKDRSDLQVSKSYGDVLKRYIASGFLDARSYHKYKHIYSGVLKNILKLDTTEEKYFVEKINCDIDTFNYEEANEYCHMFHNLHPDSETPYIMHMKLFYRLRDEKKFLKTMSLLKKSDIKFSNRALNIVRFWSGDAK